ncbi:DinB family protein [Streptomyces sedi]|uniref:DinB family protein n=1 Tax=Streptomyces sedi TaxID=555059 RepID=A0A5C4UU14_9ACTN|nr:DinB family protein [Streptomyces sedi]TNM26803.1 DinB family protein [Streptomyces sedi]
MTTTSADPADPRTHLLRYLREARESLLLKLDGLSEYDARRPLTPTGTNVLGLVKHAAFTEHGYFGVVFDQRVEPLSWGFDFEEDNIDMWATPEQSREALVTDLRRVAAHTDRFVGTAPLTTRGRVPWWPAEKAEVTVHQIALHLVAELHRHAGHADIVRELVDGEVGLRSRGNNLPERDTDWWGAYRERVEEAARTFR